MSEKQTVTKAKHPGRVKAGYKLQEWNREKKAKQLRESQVPNQEPGQEPGQEPAQEPGQEPSDYTWLLLVGAFLWGGMILFKKNNEPSEGEREAAQRSNHSQSTFQINQWME